MTYFNLFNCNHNKINTISERRSKIMRRNSKSQYSHRPKDSFHQRFVSRNTAQKDSVLNLSENVNRPHYSQNLKHKYQENQQLYTKTASKLANNNFSHHNQEDCFCNSCECGRHLCKLNVIKPDLTKNTIYQRSFYEQKSIPNIVNHDKQYDRLKGPNLDMNTTYTKGFKNRKGDEIQRPHPEDLLHSDGPFQTLTSYSNQYPGFKGDNQYIKPTNKYSRGYFPFKHKSSYSKHYTKKLYTKNDYTYFPDQLKTGSNWYGKTTNGVVYSEPDQEYFAKKVKVIQKLQENPNYSKQYQTTYQNEFKGKEISMCPAKIVLECKTRAKVNSCKTNFAENTDFKALSPNFQPSYI